MSFMGGDMATWAPTHNDNELVTGHVALFGSKRTAKFLFPATAARFFANEYSIRLDQYSMSGPPVSRLNNAAEDE